jgi:predicted amidohydrolase YtcJ
MKTQLHLIIIATILLLNGCTDMKNADLIIHNARIYTVDSDFSTAGAMAVKDGKILAVGTGDQILREYSSERVIDLSGNPVYPGFIDAHCHFLWYGIGLLKRADLTEAKSYEEVVERVVAHHEKFPAAYWIEGRGWDHNDWPGKQFPSKELLDEAFPENPVILVRIDGHAAVVNSKALEIAGITAETKVDGGDVIVENGTPTGLLIDNAIEIVSSMIPAPDNRQMSDALMAAQSQCFEVGLTGVHDMGLDYKEIMAIDSLQKTEQLKMRIYALLSPTKENFEKIMEKGTYKTDFLHIRSVKLFADGALGSRGAKLIEDYTDDPGNTGLLLRAPESLKEISQKALENNYQVCTHAIGDSANRLMLSIYGELLKGPNDKRWRIEHAQIVAPEDFVRFGDFNIIPSIQPTHATSDMYWAGERIGPERMKGAYAFKELLDQNDWIPLGTDFPIEGINPLHTFYASVARKDLDNYPTGGFQTENALSREETLKGMTIWAAKAAFEEKEKGSLEPGKFADFVVLDRDIMTIDTDELPGATVIKTFVGGTEVFSK